MLGSIVDTVSTGDDDSVVVCETECGAVEVSPGGRSEFDGFRCAKPGGRRGVMGDFDAHPVGRVPKGCDSVASDLSVVVLAGEQGEVEQRIGQFDRGIQREKRAVE